MRFFSRFFILALVLSAFLFMGGGVSRAQDTVASDSSGQKIVLKNKKIYNSDETEGEAETETGAEGEADPAQQEDEATQTSTTTCSQADHALVKRADEVLAAYGADAKYVRENQDNFESTKELEELGKRIDGYMEFIESEDFKKTNDLRTLCGIPFPPDPLNWPDWSPYPHPFFGADYKSPSLTEAAQE